MKKPPKPPKPLLTFAVNGPVVPGQPVTFTWELSARNLSPGSLTAQILINGNQVWADPAPVPFTQAKVLIGGLVIDGQYRPIYIPVLGLFAGGETQTIQPQSGAGANALYTIGTKTLTLVVTGSGPDRGPWTTTATLRVVGEAIQGNWWTWTQIPSAGTGPSTALWGGGGNKNAYIVGGIFHNHSQFSDLTFNWRIVETEQDNGNLQTQGTGTVLIGPGSTALQQSSSISQGWEFVMLGTWITDGPMKKNFQYNMEFNVQDPFGNEYPVAGGSPAFISGNLVVDVQVPEWKVLAAATADGSQAAAVGTAAATVAAFLGVVTTAAAPILATAAGAVEAAAATAGLVARDPPFPDPKFNEGVPVVYHSISKNLAESTEFSAMAEFLSGILRMTDQLSVLDAIEGKILGAKVAGDEAALLTQTTAYLGFVGEIGAQYATISRSVALAQQELDRVIDPNKLRSLLRRWAKEGIPASALKSARAAGLSKPAIESLKLALRDPRRVELAASPTIFQQLAVMFYQLVRGVQTHAVEVLRSMPLVPHPVGSKKATRQVR